MAEKDNITIMCTTLGIEDIVERLREEKW